MLSTLKKKNIFSSFLAWSLYTVVYIIFTKYNELLAGYIALIGQTSLDVIAMIVILEKHKKTTKLKNKLIYLIFFISFLSASFSDLTYNISMNILQVKYLSDTNLLFEIPFVIFLLFQVIAWSMIFFHEFKFAIRKNKYACIPYATISILLFIMFIFGIHWKIKYASHLGLCQIIDTVLEMLGFILAAGCLTRAKNISLHILPLGFLIIISSDILIRYHVVSGSTPFLSFFETTWVFGLLFMIQGFCRANSNFALSPINSIHSNIAIWILNIFLLFLTLFSITTHLFSSTLGYDFNQININLLSILIPFTIIALSISKYLSYKISSPLEKIECLIGAFSQNKFYNVSKKPHISNNSIFEFAALENFIYEAFAAHQKNRNFEIKLATLSTQVAHDIRSPLAALTMLTTENFDISDQARLQLHDIINRIRDIANDLIEKYHDQQKVDNVFQSSSVHLLTSLLSEIISEKRLQLGSDSKIIIEFEINAKNYGLFIEVNAREFKRMLSNIINNAIEAIYDKGTITIKAYRKSKNILLIIYDNGKGIPPDILNRLGNRGISYGKKSGSGLGLYHANLTMKSLGGNLQLQSGDAQGTRVILTFPVPEIPYGFHQESKLKSLRL